MRSSSAALLLLCVLVAPPLRGQDRTRSATEDRWRAHDAAFAALDAPSVHARLGAILAMPEHDAPHRALGPLGELARGDHPTLAPAALSAAWRIVRDLDVDSMMAAEVNLDEVRASREPYAALAADESARADLRHVAAFVVAALDDLTASATWPTAE